MDSFEQELLAMEREVRALKTIHQRGLGTTQFYVYEREIEISVTSNWFLEATVENVNNLPMVVLPFVGGSTIRNFQIAFTDDEFVVSSLATQGTVTIRIITSAILSSIQTRTTPW